MAHSPRWLLGQVGGGRQRQPPRGTTDAAQATWKFYYEARNYVFYRLRVQRSAAAVTLMARDLTMLLLRIVVREDRRLRKLTMYLRGLGDGVLGRLGKLVAVEDDGPTKQG